MRRPGIPFSGTPRTRPRSPAPRYNPRTGCGWWAAPRPPRWRSAQTAPPRAALPAPSAARSRWGRSVCGRRKKSPPAPRRKVRCQTPGGAPGAPGRSLISPEAPSPRTSQHSAARPASTASACGPPWDTAGRPPGTGPQSPRRSPPRRTAAHYGKAALRAGRPANPVSVRRFRQPVQHHSFSNRSTLVTNTVAPPTVTCRGRPWPPRCRSWRCWAPPRCAACSSPRSARCIHPPSRPRCRSAGSYCRPSKSRPWWTAA